MRPSLKLKKLEKKLNLISMFFDQLTNTKLKKLYKKTEKLTKSSLILLNKSRLLNNNG